MRLWLDDIRTPPIGWTWAKTSAECIDLLQTNSVQELSLDHDLGEAHYLGKYDEDTGYAVVLFLEANPEHVPPLINLHTMNPVGRDRMKLGCRKMNTFVTIRLPEDMKR